MRALQRLQRWSPPLGRLAAFALIAYLALFLVSPLKWQTETNSQIPLGWWVARHVWSQDRLENHANTPINNFLFAAFGLVPVIAMYLLQLRAAVRDDTRAITLRTVLGYASAYAALMLFIPRTLSSDVFSYIAYGRIQSVYHGNPLIDVPADFSDAMSPHIAFGPFAHVASAYGPVWLAISRVLSVATGAFGDVAWHYELTYKLFAAGCHIACAALLWSILGRLRPSHRVLGTILYAWNPLMLAETAWNAHNDVLVLLFVLASVWARTREKSVLASVLLALSVPVKWITAILVPLYVIADARDGATRRDAWRRAMRSSAIVGAVIALTFVPYWRGPSTTLASARDAPGNHFTTNSLADMLLSELRWARYRREHPEFDPVAYARDGGRAPGSPDTLVTDGYAPLIAARENGGALDWSLSPPRPYGALERVLRFGLNAMLVLVVLDRARRVRDTDTMLLGWGWSLFAYVAAAALWFWPWYLVWFLGVAALTGWDRLGKTAAILGVSGAMVYFAGLFGPWGQHARALFAFVPPYGFMAWSLWRERRGTAAPA